MFTLIFLIPLATLYLQDAVYTLPAPACFAPFNGRNCGKTPVTVMAYHRAGSRCEAKTWRGCLPNINMFKNEYECVTACIFSVKARADAYHKINQLSIEEDDYEEENMLDASTEPTETDEDDTETTDSIATDSDDADSTNPTESTNNPESDEADDAEPEATTTEGGEQDNETESGDEDNKTEVENEATTTEGGDKDNKTEVENEATTTEGGDQGNETEVENEATTTEGGDQDNKTESGDEHNKTEVENGTEGGDVDNETDAANKDNKTEGGDVDNETDAENKDNITEAKNETNEDQIQKTEEKKTGIKSGETCTKGGTDECVPGAECKEETSSGAYKCECDATKYVVQADLTCKLKKGEKCEVTEDKCTAHSKCEGDQGEEVCKCTSETVTPKDDGTCPVLGSTCEAESEDCADLADAICEQLKCNCPTATHTPDLTNDKCTANNSG